MRVRLTKPIWINGQPLNVGATVDLKPRLSMDLIATGAAQEFETESTPYKKIKMKDGSTRDEHRVLMEQHIGRRLKRNEVVHHINGDKRDNRIDNLEIMTASEHASMHMKDLHNRGLSAPPPEEFRFRPGCKPVNAKHSDETIIKVREMSSAGKPYSEIKKETGVPTYTIKDIVRGKSYTKVGNNPKQPKIEKD